VQNGLNQFHEELPVSSRSRLRLDGCTHSFCSAVSRTWQFPGSGPPHQLAMGKSNMQKDELIIQLLKIGLGLVFAAYFLWWSLEVLSRLPPH
jgi:hypothetical protein